MIETNVGIVRPHHLDHMGHMNVQWYTAKFDNATWSLFSYVGLNNAYFTGQMKGMAALEQTTNYLKEVVLGESLTCKSEILEIKQKTLRFKHHMYLTNQTDCIATTEIIAAHLDRTKRKACPFPTAIHQKCQIHALKQ